MPIKRPQATRAARLAMTTALVTALAGCDGRIGRGIDSIIGPFGSDKMPGDAATQTATATAPVVIAPGNPTYSAQSRAQDLQQFEQVYGPPVGTAGVVGEAQPAYSLPSYNDGAVQSSALTAPSYGPLPASTPVYQDGGASYGVTAPAPYTLDASESVAAVIEGGDAMTLAQPVESYTDGGGAASVSYLDETAATTRYTDATSAALSAPVAYAEPVVSASAVELEYTAGSDLGAYSVAPEFGPSPAPEPMLEPMIEPMLDGGILQQDSMIGELPVIEASAPLGEVEMAYAADIAPPPAPGFGNGVLPYGAAFGEPAPAPAEPAPAFAVFDEAPAAPAMVDTELASLFGSETAMIEGEEIPMVTVGEPRQKPMRSAAGGQFVVTEDASDVVALSAIEIAPMPLPRFVSEIAEDAPSAAPRPAMRPEYAATNYRVAQYGSVPRRRPASFDRIIVAAGAKVDLPADSAAPAPAAPAPAMVDMGELSFDELNSGVVLNAEASRSVIEEAAIPAPAMAAEPVIEAGVKAAEAEMVREEAEPAIVPAKKAEIVVEETVTELAAVEVKSAAPSFAAPKLPSLEVDIARDSGEAPKVVSAAPEAPAEEPAEEMKAEDAMAAEAASDEAETVELAYAPDLAAVTEQRPRTAPAVTSKLSGTSWRLVELDGAAVEGDAELHFDGSSGFAGGQGPCNSYGGEYKNDEPGSFRMSSIFATEMPCEQRELEGAYIEMLETARGYETTAKLESLELIGTDGEIVARFKAF